MTTVDVLATLPTPAPAASTTHKSHGDGFARELEVASRPEARSERERSREIDNSARNHASELSQATEKGRRAHDHHPTTRCAQAAGAAAKDSATTASDAGAAASTAADANSTPANSTPANSTPANSTPANSTPANSTPANSTPANSTPANSTDATAAAAFGAGDQTPATSDSATTATAAAATVFAAAAATTTDSVGPGNASSGEASQDPTVTRITPTSTPIVAAQGTATSATVAMTASAQQEGAAAITHTGVPSSLPTEVASTKVPGSAAATPAASGEQAAGPVAVAEAGSGSTDGQSSDRGARDRASTTAPLTAVAQTTPVSSTQATAEAPATDPAAPVPPRGAISTSTLPVMATTDAGIQVSAAATPSSSPAAAPASPNQPTFPTPLASQLSGQLTSLRQLPQGEHILTLTVNPETFGPVKVVARITHDGVSLQVFGASEQARAALKAALPDLRRDLAGAGLEPSLELGSGSGSGAGGRDAMGDPSSFAGNGGTPQRATRPAFGRAATVATSTASPISHATRRGGLDLVL